MPEVQTEGIGLVEFIGAVKRELVRTHQAAGKNPILELDDVELEMTFVTSKEAEGGIHFWVVDIGGGYSKEQTHTLRVKLAPIGRRIPRPGNQSVCDLP